LLWLKQQQYESGTAAVKDLLIIVSEIRQHSLNIYYSTSIVIMHVLRNYVALSLNGANVSFVTPIGIMPCLQSYVVSIVSAYF
jgi:hypothetical protein